jgi:hypothetical protein
MEPTYFQQSPATTSGGPVMHLRHLDEVYRRIALNVGRVIVVPKADRRRAVDPGPVRLRRDAGMSNI